MLIEKDMEGNDHGLIEVFSQNLPQGTDEDHRRSQIR
jgi:hypothetical protein